MIENQLINGKEVWLKIDPKPVERENDNVIPREYFTARYYFMPPNDDINDGEPITDEDGSMKLFESPVAALTHAWKAIKESSVHRPMPEAGRNFFTIYIIFFGRLS